MQPYQKLITPLISLIILTLGSALLTTFLSLRLHQLQVNEFFIGGLTTAYYAGMVIGAFRLERLILRVGHIHAYAAFASIMAVVSLLHGFYVTVPFWLLLRFVGGIATAGLYIVIESWILAESTPKNRGASLAWYMVSLYIAQALGQWLLNLGHQQTLLLCALAAVFASLSVIPLSLSRVVLPVFNEPEPLSIRQVLKITPSGVLTCFAAGLILGSLYGLYPLFIKHQGYSTADLATVMGVTILGGMLFQYPIGKLSDLISRRYVIAGLALGSLGLSFLLLDFAHSHFWAMAGLSLGLGGVTFCLYPVGISHACDRFNSNQMVAATQALLLAYGVGVTLGPILVPAFHWVLPNAAILAFIMTLSLPLSVFVLLRKQIVPSVPEAEKTDFINTAELTPIINEIDPRAEESSS